MEENKINIHNYFSKITDLENSNNTLLKQHSIDFEKIQESKYGNNKTSRIVNEK